MFTIVTKSVTERDEVTKFTNFDKFMNNSWLNS